MGAKIKLYGFEGSNSVYTGRLMLEHKGLDYDFVKLPPAAHTFILLAMGFPTMGAPALKIDGARVQGTRWIARALDERFAQAPLFPADPVQRRAVQDAERWGEDFQNATRRIFYCAARRNRSAFLSVMAAGRGPVKRTALRVMAPLIMRLATGAHRATDESGREDLELLPERLEQIDAWIAEGVIGGQVANAADYQIAVNLSALLLSEDLAPFIEGRPAGALARRFAPDYAGHIPQVVPEEWMAPLRAQAVAGGSSLGAPAAPAGVAGVGDRDDAQIGALARRPRA